MFSLFLIISAIVIIRVILLKIMLTNQHLNLTEPTLLNSTGFYKMVMDHKSLDSQWMKKLTLITRIKAQETAVKNINWTRKREIGTIQ